MPSRLGDDGDEEEISSTAGAVASGKRRDEDLFSLGFRDGCS